VWSFSPPEDDLIDEDRSGSPVSMPDHAMIEYQVDQEHASLSQEQVSMSQEQVSVPEDVDMPDAFESDEKKKKPNPFSERVARRLASVNGRKEPLALSSVQPPRRPS